jgi:signal peptidase I
MAARAEPRAKRRDARVRDPYAVLGVGRDASSDEIAAAYRRLAEEHGENSSSGWYDVELAYRTLSDPQRRARYDQFERGTLAPSPPEETPPVPPPRKRRHSWNPVDRLTAGLPRPWRIAIDWIVTIAGAIAIVLAIKAWVVNPYRIPSSSMEPTLHCARPGPGCLARFSDRVLANRFIYHLHPPRRGDIIVFKTPRIAAERCGAGGTFVKRLIGLPGDRWEERNGFIYIDGKRLSESYVKPDRRDTRTLTLGPILRDAGIKARAGNRIPPGYYFMMGDNRLQSCDSREWGPVPRRNIIGKVFAVYWPPNRIGFR